MIPQISKIKPIPIREYWIDKSSISVIEFTYPIAENDRKPPSIRAIPRIMPTNWFMKLYPGNWIECILFKHCYQFFFHPVVIDGDNALKQHICTKPYAFTDTNGFLR